MRLFSVVSSAPNPMPTSAPMRNLGFFTIDASIALLIFSLAASFALSFMGSEASGRYSHSAYSSRSATLAEIADFLIRQEGACQCASFASCKIQHCIDSGKLLQVVQEKYAANPRQFGFSYISISIGSAQNAKEGQQCVRRSALAGSEEIRIWLCGVPI